MQPFNIKERNELSEDSNISKMKYKKRRDSGNYVVDRKKSSFAKKFN